MFLLFGMFKLIAGILKLFLSTFSFYINYFGWFNKIIVKFTYLVKFLNISAKSLFSYE